MTPISKGDSMNENRDNHVMIVTGANSGLGLATTIELAKTGASVVMLCRDQTRGERALQQVRSTVENDQIYLMLADLADLDSVAAFSRQFHDRFERLDVLVNNAGVFMQNRGETKQGLEMQFGVNHVGHFLLTLLLSDLLAKTDDSRVVVVSSGAHKAGRIYYEDLQLKNKYNMVRGYAQSKLANILFALKLAEYFEDKNTAVNCCHPGPVATNLGIDRITGFGKLIVGLLKPFFITPEKGAKTQVALALTDLGSKNEAAYYYKMKKTEPGKMAKSREDAEKLWQISITLTKDYLPEAILSQQAL